MNKKYIIHKIKNFFKFIKKTYQAWERNDPFARSAIIAYYALFSLPSLLMIISAIAGYFFGQRAVEGRIQEEIGNFIGPKAAEAVETMISNASVDSGSWVTVAIGLGALFFGATGVFFQMKKTMNMIWNVKEKQENIKMVLINRAISFGMVLTLGFLLLISLVISAGLQALSTYVENSAPYVAVIVVDVLKYLLPFVFITVLFAAMFKLLPDVKITYKTTFLGAAITAVLFMIGEYALGYYFSAGDPVSVYGGAASVVLILLWVNYTCLILFFGAEITVQYAISAKHKIEPNRFAELVDNPDTQELREKQEAIQKTNDEIERKEKAEKEKSKEESES